jgi:proton-dependent oligopeptide transporter, POT family
MAVVIVFCGAYEQNGNTIALWADAGIDRHIIGRWFFPLTWFQALNPLMMSLVTPRLVAHWTCLAKLGREPSSVRKMVTGAVVTAAAYSIIALVCAHADAHDAQSSWLWLDDFVTVGQVAVGVVGHGVEKRSRFECACGITIG